MLTVFFVFPSVLLSIFLVFCVVCLQSPYSQGRMLTHDISSSLIQVHFAPIQQKSS